MAHDDRYLGTWELVHAAMDNRYRAALGGIIVAGNVGVTAYAALVAWLLGARGLDDAVGARMTDQDWQLVAGRRALVVVVVALVVAGALYVLDRVVIRRTGLLAPAWARRLALGAGVVVWAAGTAGAVEFLIERPWW
ncbi:MAG TPA: hypothetical protein VEZ47_13285 [Gemmatirosa sp.]|nr:hypothetical protein [Gemmatirosa sp.]